ncbi:hypothetical protein BKA70DRAFT_335365 [Coprinopsis sp. MPI-PUGE-AT-0042]|nr:hypothetical protein BKA70DRAFT_335365 [Coprinopsis sp. MPI-PUGE-AT-0042]
MVYSALSLVWFLLYLCAAVSAAPIAPVLDAARPPWKRDSAPPSAYHTPTVPISRRYLSSRSARSANDAQIRNFLRKRELVITMLNGAPVESRFVNLLDLWHMAEKAVERTPPGTPRHAELVDFQETTAFQLTRLMQGVAILQSVVNPGPTPSLEIDEEPAATIAEATATSSPTTNSSVSQTASQSSSDSVPSPTPTSGPAQPATAEAPQTSSPVAAPTSSTAAGPIPTVAPEAIPAPAPQPPSPVPGDGTVAAGNNPNAGGVPAPGVPNASAVASGSGAARSDQADAAQATGDINLAGSAMRATRLSGMSWVVLGALTALGAGVL